MRLRSKFFLLFLALTCFKAFAQDIADISKKMSFPSDLPIPRFIISLSDTLNGVSLRMNDLKKNSITPQKLNLLKDIEYVEICFSNQSDLNALVGLLIHFKQLKYLRLSDNPYYLKTTADTITLPHEIANYNKIKAISFSGGWQIDYAKSMAVLQQLPALNFFLFENLNQEIPKELLRFTQLKGLSIYSNNSLAFPDWIVQFPELESLSMGFSQYKKKGDNYLNYTDVFKKLARVSGLKSLYISSMYQFKDPYDDITLKNVETLKINSGIVNKSGEFFKFLSNHLKLCSLEVNGVTFDTLKKDLTKLKLLTSLKLEGRNNPLIMDFSLKQLTKLKFLDLSNFSRVPEDLEFPSGLISLNLSGNSMGKIPSSIGNLHDLTSLNLNYNAFIVLPHHFHRLKKLTYLDLSNNKVNQLPEDISKLVNLETLNLHANPLKGLPQSISKLKNLRELDLSYCDLKTLPENFGNLRNLETLKIVSNFIESLPANFTALTNLKYANFEVNNLTKLPADMGRLLNLRYLNFSANHILTLPPSIGALSKLEELNFSYNNLSEVPEELSNMVGLKKLYLHNSAANNQRSYDPREIYRKDDPKPHRITSSNTIKNLPKDLRNWTKLSVIGMNNYTTLNDVVLFQSLFTIPAIGFSVEFENSNISTLPLTGWKNFNVGVLNLRTNKLTTIPADIIHAPYLFSYNFNNNKLPSKPVNFNSYAANKYEKLLWFKEFGLITTSDLPKVDSMVLALLEKSNNHYYRKEFKQSVDYANQAIGINKDLALSKIYKTNFGEANYEIGNYKEAITQLTRASPRLK